LGEALIPDEHTVLQEGDLIHVIASDNEISNIEKTLAKSPDGN
jgi:trk system potassium uptake protein TrkA